MKSLWFINLAKFICQQLYSFSKRILMHRWLDLTLSLSRRCQSPIQMRHRLQFQLQGYSFVFLSIYLISETLQLIWIAFLTHRTKTLIGNQRDCSIFKLRRGIFLTASIRKLGFGIITNILFNIISKWYHGNWKRSSTEQLRVLAIFNARTVEGT